MEKDQKQPQGSAAPQGGPPASPPDPKKVQETIKQQVNKSQEYQKQLGEAQTKYAKRYQAAWNQYYERVAGAYDEYSDTVRNVQDGERKAAAQAPKEDESPAKNMEAFKAARLKSLHHANEVHGKLRDAERKYNTKLTSFWDDVWNSVAEAVEEFYDWIVGWWEEPPVEGGGALRSLADPAWRNAFDPTAAYYSGWNYAAKLY